MKTPETIRAIAVGVDIQNDFIDGSLAVPEGETIVAPFNRTTDAVRRIGGAVILTRDWHPKETPHFADYGGPWPTHCVAETRGADFSPALDVQPNDIILSKGMGQTDGYSGWEGTTDNGATLETLITPITRGQKVRVFIGGLATDYCVKATAIDIASNFADDERVTTYLLRDAVRGVNIRPDDSDRALADMRAAGVIEIDSQAAIAMLQGEVR